MFEKEAIHHPALEASKLTESAVLLSLQGPTTTMSAEYREQVHFLESFSRCIIDLIHIHAHNTSSDLFG